MLETVTLPVAAVPTSTVPKSRLPGTLARGGGGGLVPFPASATECGAQRELSLNDSVALRSPTVIGVKTTRIVRVSPGARVALPPPEAMLKSGSPLTVTLICSGAVPLFVTVTGRGALRVPYG